MIPRDDKAPVAGGQAQSGEQRQSNNTAAGTGAQQQRPLFMARFRVGKYTVVMSIWADRIDCEWSPTFPRRLSRRAIRQYRRQRDTARQHTSVSGRRVMVVDV